MHGGRWGGGAAALAVTLIATVAVTPSPAATPHSVRVHSDYFGVNYPLMSWDEPEVRETQLRSISETGIGTVRVAISWATLEPDPPQNGLHTYDWTNSDKQVTLTAAHGLRLGPAFMYTPDWATAVTPSRCHPPVSFASGVGQTADYAEAAAALAKRYGRRGSFWKEHPELPHRPIKTWEIWNEPNLGSYWCPRPDPGGYADLFVRAARAIHEVDPKARVVTGGLVLVQPGADYLEIGEFWAGMRERFPDVWKHADGVGFHVFPAGTVQEQFALIAHTRARMNAAGVPRSLPMIGTEIGWGLEAFGLTEEDRAARYRYLTRRLPSSNCRIDAMYAQAWTTAIDGMVYDHGSGIAHETTGELFPSAVAFRDSIEVLSGRGEREAPHRNLRHCDGMPKLDRDGDRRAEHRDYYPLDARRWEGPLGWYDGIKLTGKRKQQLGKPIVVNAECEENCRVEVSGKASLSGASDLQSLKLQRVRTKLEGGKPAKLTLEPTANAASTIRRSDTKRGKATIKGISTVEGERFAASLRIRLR